MMNLRSFALRCRWYVRALGRNPVVRVGDRLEALAVAAAIAIGLLAIPLAARVEDQTYRSHLPLVAEQTQTRHSVQATVIEGSTGLPTDLGTPLYALVQWHDGSRLRTEQVISPGTVDTGATLPIWVDTTGKVVNAPLKAVDVKISAVSVGWTTWVLIAIVAGLAALAVRLWLDRCRARAWERALQLMSHNDDGWANRHA